MTHDVTIAVLNLDHLSTKVSQRLTDPGASQNPGQFDNFQTFKRFHTGFLAYLEKLLQIGRVQVKVTSPTQSEML